MTQDPIVIRFMQRQAEKLLVAANQSNDPELQDQLIEMAYNCLEQVDTTSHGPRAAPPH